MRSKAKFIAVTEHQVVYVHVAAGHVLCMCERHIA